MELPEKSDLITQQIWFVLNKNNEILMFLDEPVKNPKTKKWEGKCPLRAIQNVLKFNLKENKI